MPQYINGGLVNLFANRITLQMHYFFKQTNQIKCQNITPALTCLSNLTLDLIGQIYLNTSGQAIDFILFMLHR